MGKKDGGGVNAVLRPLLRGGHPRFGLGVVLFPHLAQFPSPLALSFPPDASVSLAERWGPSPEP